MKRIVHQLVHMRSPSRSQQAPRGPRLLPEPLAALSAGDTESWEDHGIVMISLNIEHTDKRNINTEIKTP